MTSRHSAATARVNSDAASVGAQARSNTGVPFREIGSPLELQTGYIVTCS